MSRANKGVPKREEHKQKIREAAERDWERRRDQGWKRPVEATEASRQKNIGRVHAREGVERMRASKIGKVRQYQSDGTFRMVNPT